jgi:hypothetical protein
MMTVVGISEYEGKKPETVESLNEVVEIRLWDPEEDHPEEIPNLDGYHAARIRSGSERDYGTAVDSGVPTVHNPGWLDLWNERYSFTELLESAEVKVPGYELWSSKEDAKNSDLDFPVVLQPNSHFGPGRHDTKVVSSREDIEGSDLLGEETYVSEFIEHDTLHKIYRVGDNIRPVKFENHGPLCDQREAEMAHPSMKDWMKDLASNVDEATGEKLWSVDLVEGDERFAVDLNMVTSTSRMNGSEIYAEYVLDQLDIE